MRNAENQSIVSVKKKLELEKEETVKKVKEEMKVCNGNASMNNCGRILFPRDQGRMQNI